MDTDARAAFLDDLDEAISLNHSAESAITDLIGLHDTRSLPNRGHYALAGALYEVERAGMVLRYLRDEVREHGDEVPMP